MTVPGPLAQLRRLVPPFFARFFESESTDGADDPKLAFFALIAILAVPGFLLPLLLAGASHPTPGATVGGIDPSDMGWSMIAQYQGVDALRAVSRADKAFYLGFAMIASAIISVIVWNALLLDRRDRIVLGPLPVGQPTLIAAKLIALAGYVAAVAIAMHTLASLTFGIALAANNAFGFAIRGIAAHFIASVAASACVMFTVIAVQGIAVAVTGPRWFVRLSPILQLTLVSAIVVGVVITPAMSQAVAGVLDGAGPHADRWMLAPPLWFLGLYEAMLGTSDATLIELARTAALAVLISGGVGVASFLLGSRRATLAATSAPRLHRSALAISTAAALVCREPQRRAATQFFLTTIARSHRHRLVLASALGVAAAWGLPGWVALIEGVPQPDTALLASGLAVPLFLLLGLRIAAWMPVDLRAAWAFELPPLPWHMTRSVIERTMVIAAVLPAVALFGVLYWWLWGITAALLHAVFTLSITTLLVQALLWRFEGVPCTRPWSREVLRLRHAWPAYLAVLLTLSRGLPSLEAMLLSRPITCACFAIYVLMLAYRIRVTSRALPAREEAVEVLTSALRTASWANAEGAVTSARSAAESAAEATSAPAFLGVPSGDRGAAETLRARDALAMLRPSRVFRDVRLAFRRLAAAPLFTAFSILTLGCGVGITTGVYSVVHAALWTTPPIPDIDRVVDVRAPNGRTVAGFSWSDFDDMRGRQTVFTGLAAATMLHAPVVAGDIREVVYAEAVNGSYFSTLAIRPVVGRLIQPSDDRPDAPPVVVLSYNVWRLRFQSDPGVVGSTVRIDGRLYDVIGVTPSGFRGWDFSNLARSPVLFVPLATAPDEVADRMRRNDRRFAWLAVKGRLADGQTIEQASAQMMTIGRALEAEFPTAVASADGAGTRFGRRWFASSSRMEEGLGLGLVARIFVCTVAAVLLIGCTNLANLAIARGASREHELGVRRALGASRVDLLREQLAETMLVATAGGILAFAIIRLTTTTLSVEVPAGPGQFILIEPRLNLPLLLFAAGAGLCALVTFGIWPALHLTRAPASAGLTTGGGATAPHWRLHRRLIGWQVGASVTLLLVAAACVNAIVVHALHDTGVDVDRVAIASVDFATNRYDAARMRAAVDGILAAAARHPDITAVAASADLPFGRGRPEVWSAASAGQPSERSELIQLVPATHDILKTLGVRIVHGRAFSAQDIAASRGVAIVSESFAVRHWATADVAGRELRLTRTAGRGVASGSDEVLAIVGVAAATDAGSTGSREHGVVYVPLDERFSRTITFIARSDGDPRAALMALRGALRQVDPNMVVDRAATGMMYLAGQYVVLGFVAAVVTTLGGVALLLAMSGLFGVVSHLVARRTRELAVRIALGAERSRIMRLVFVDGLRPIADGLALGLFGGAVSRSIIGATMSSSVAAVDPIAFVVVPVIFVATAVGACYWPARRASRVDPNVALREN